MASLSPIAKGSPVAGFASIERKGEPDVYWRPDSRSRDKSQHGWHGAFQKAST